MLTMYQVLRATDTNRDTSSTDPTTQSEQCQVAVKMLGAGGLREEAGRTLTLRLCPQKVKLLRTNARLRSTSLNATVAVRKEGGRGEDRAEAQVLRCACLADLRLGSQQRRREGQKKGSKERWVGR